MRQSWVKNMIKLQLYQFIANTIYTRLHQGESHLFKNDAAKR